MHSGVLRSCKLGSAGTYGHPMSASVLLVLPVASPAPGDFLETSMNSADHYSHFLR